MFQLFGNDMRKNMLSGEINKLCEKCKKDCKQSHLVDIIKCPFYEAKEKRKSQKNSTHD